MESGLDIKYLRNYIEDSDVSIERDTRHNLYYNQIESMLHDNIYYEPEYYPYTLLYKNTKRPLKIRKVYPPVICNPPDILKEYKSEFKKPSKSKFMRFRKIGNERGEEFAQFRYKLTDTSDIIEQVPMIKLLMIAHMSYDYLEYRVVTTEEYEFDPRIEFRFWFLDEATGSYSKEVIISVDHSVLFGLDNLPIIADGTDPLKDKEHDLQFVSNNNKISKTHLFHLLIKALILITNLLKIDLERANINSYIATIRGGIIYRLELDPDVDIDDLEYSLQDVRKRNESRKRNGADQNGDPNRDSDIVHSMWIAENILDVLSTIKPTSDSMQSKSSAKAKSDKMKSKLTKRKPTLSGLSCQNRASKSIRMNQKRIAIPYSKYSMMIKNLFESDTLLGITAGNTFLYIIDSLEVDDTGNLLIFFLNPIRGNVIKTEIHSVLSGIKRIGLILDREIINQLEHNVF